MNPRAPQCLSYALVVNFFVQGVAELQVGVKSSPELVDSKEWLH